jgi:hypothetical protein
MTTIVGAGCLFIQQGYALVGYSQKYKHYSGFGGKQNVAETPIQTALRETAEELLGIEPTKAEIEHLGKLLEHKKLITRNNYAFLVLKIDDISVFSNVFGVRQSPYYKTIPKNCSRFILERNPTETAEITEMKIIKVVSATNGDVDNEFIEDCIWSLTS